MIFHLSYKIHYYPTPLSNLYCCVALARIHGSNDLIILLLIAIRIELHVADDLVYLLLRLSIFDFWLLAVTGRQSVERRTVKSETTITPNPPIPISVSKAA